jgi:DNA-binding NtrC family response regulator
MIRLLTLGLEQELVEALATDGFQLQLARSIEEAFSHLAERHFNGILCDLSGIENEGLSSLVTCGQAVLIITDRPHLSAAVQAVKEGATDLLLKPCQTSLVIDTCHRLFNAAVSSTTEVRTTTSRRRPLSKIIGSSPQMLRVFETIESAARFPSTVLIVGETGTGKELVARAIHEMSPRSSRPMVSINCAAIPETLLEDELFGHVKGAFTGAHQTRIGRFEQADGGTIFLDEIGEMSLNLQAKLLRVLQEREFERLGSGRTIKVDVRVIAATSAELEEKIRQGEFRKDLYYRLNVIAIKLPALRDRREDLPQLAAYFLNCFSQAYGLPPKSLTPATLERLSAYDWPGNIRQLQNVIERATILSGNRAQLSPCDLPEELTPAEASPPLQTLSIPEGGLNFDSVVSNIERELLLESLRRTGGNKCQAARLLNLKRTTFIEKLKRLNLTPETEPALS